MSGMDPLEAPWPFALVEIALSGLRRLEAEHVEAEEIEILFGDGAMETLGRDLLRQLTAVTRFHGVPVTFPEKPGLWPAFLDVKVLSPRGGAQVCIPAEIVLESAGKPT